jgi:hypothetical protein
MSEIVESAPQTDASPKKVRRRGCGCWTILLTAFVVLFVVPLTLLIVTYAALLVSDRYWLEREMEVARENGYPLTLEELEAEYPASLETEEATAHWQRGIEIVNGEEYKQSSVDVPIVYLQPNQYPRVEEPLPLSADRLATARRFVEEHTEVLQAARAAREAGAVARFPFEFEKLIHADLTHAEGLRNVARLLKLDLELRLVERDSEGAVENVLDQIAVADSLTNEPNLVSQLTRMAILGAAVDSTTETLSRIDLTDDGSARLQQAFARQRPMQGYVKGLRGERYMAPYLTRFDSPIDDPEIELHPFPLFANSDIAKQCEFLRMLEEAATSDSPDLDDSFGEVEFEIENFVHRTWTAGARYYFTCTMLPMTNGMSRSFVRQVANARLAETAIAAERYRLANGEWPERLEDLAPEYLKSIPIDPCSGKPLILRIETDFTVRIDDRDDSATVSHGPGLLLMSVGANRRDDGGRDGFMQDYPLFLPKRAEEQGALNGSDHGQMP